MNEGKAPQAESVLQEGIATFADNKTLPMVQGTTDWKLASSQYESTANLDRNIHAT